MKLKKIKQKTVYWNAVEKQIDECEKIINDLSKKVGEDYEQYKSSRIEMLMHSANLVYFQVKMIKDEKEKKIMLLDKLKTNIEQLIKEK